MGRVGSFVHMPAETGLSVSVLSASWSSPVPITLDASGRLMRGRLSALYAYVNTIAGGATKLTARIARDSNGDELVLPDTEADIAVGAVTTTDGTAVWDLSIDYIATIDQVYVLFKTDAGTCTLSEAALSWHE